MRYTVVMTMNKSRVGTVSIALYAAFVLCLVAGICFIHFFVVRPQIDSLSYAHAGKVIKGKFPVYSHYTDEEAGRQLYGKGYITPEQRFVLKSVGLTDDDIAGLVTWKSYSPLATALIYSGLVAVLLIALFGTRRAIGKKSKAGGD